MAISPDSSPEPDPETAGATSDPEATGATSDPDGSGATAPGSAGPEPAAAAAATGATRQAHWSLSYLRNGAVHLAVILLFAAYPGIHEVAVSSAFGSEAAALLPRIDTMVAVMYFGLFAISFDFVSGYTGYLSFGHAAFYGTGAYFVILVANGKVPLLGAETPFMVSLVVAALLAALLAVLIGALSFRLTGVYFAMITLGFAQVLYVLVRDWDYLAANPTDGPAVSFDTHPAGFDVGVPWVDQLNLAIGQLTGDQVEGLFGFVTLNGTEVSYYMVGLVVVVCYFAMQRIIHSPFGRVMVAIRENEERAEAVGYEPFRYKLAAFAMSAFFAGVAGALFAGFRRSATPDNSFHFLVTGHALLAAIIGGFGTLAGSLYGHLFDESVREFLSKAGAGGGLLPYLRENLPASVLETVLYNGMTVQEGIETFLNGHAPLYVGLLFVLFVLYVPNGLLGTVRDRLGGPVAKRVPDHLQRGRR